MFRFLLFRGSTKSKHKHILYPNPLYSFPSQLAGKFPQNSHYKQFEFIKITRVPILSYKED
jgi:hypothetical protein